MKNYETKSRERFRRKEYFGETRLEKMLYKQQAKEYRRQQELFLSETLALENALASSSFEFLLLRLNDPLITEARRKELIDEWNHHILTQI